MSCSCHGVSLDITPHPQTRSRDFVTGRELHTCTRLALHPHWIDRGLGYRLGLDIMETDPFVGESVFSSLRFMSHNYNCSPHNTQYSNIQQRLHVIL